jgi:hypothetical protein
VKQPNAQRYERYEFDASPWTQNLTQRDLADLLLTTKDRLEGLIRDKDKWVGRRYEEIAGKRRNLAVPYGKLRTIHERLKFHLNKIKQPDYLFSPRKGRGQRDNAEHHAGQNQFLTLDIRQFYPSTTSEHIFRWGFHVAGLREDVAGLLAHLVSVDGKMPFGSPISPVLTTHVHRGMFDAIYAICQTNGLKMSLWVDDLTISGQVINGNLIEQIRAAIRKSGFQTHKIRFRSGSRPVVVTGVPIEGPRVAAPRSLHQRIQQGYADLRTSKSDSEQAQIMDRLLSALGTYRYHLGASSPEGRITSNRMHSLRQRRKELVVTAVTHPSAITSVSIALVHGDTTAEAPWA